MNIKYLRLLFIIALLFLSIIFNGNILKNSKYISKAPIYSDTTQFDSSLVLKMLQISAEDSLILHLYEKEDYSHFLQEFISLNYINDSSIQYYIRTLISVYSGEKEMSSLGYFRILYKLTIDDFKVSRIAVDSIDVSHGALDYYYLEQLIIDINYDGFKDIVISFIQNTTGRNYLNYFFVFDSTKQKFKEDKELNSTFQEEAIYIDTDSREISTGGRIGTGFSGEDYRWNGSKYELFSTNEIIFLDSVQLLIRKEFKNGIWETVETDTL